ncbi:MAG TPA: pectin acetylesterase-family hydrolase [Polyangiaceae bacterium]|nr:pectin acetylesterase-family hydrolase [Polyangiaceae bacterium]
MNVIQKLEFASFFTALLALHCANETITGDGPGNLGPGTAGGFSFGGNGAGGGSGNAPGGGGYTPGGGGSNPGAGGGSGNAPGGGGYTPGGGGYSPGGGGSNPGSGGGGVAGGSVGGNTNYVVDPVGNANRAPGYVDLSPPMGAPLDGVGMTLNPPAPTGWVYYQIDGSKCRDGSPAGFFVHTGTVNNLMIYLEGGGACSNNGFCNFNPASVTSVLAGDGSSVLGSAAGTGVGARPAPQPNQQPGVYTDLSHTAAPAGVLDISNAQNPVKDWSAVYVPYCTGDVHYGKKPNGTVPGLATPQQFVGGTNMELFIGRIVPTFKDKVQKVVLTGSSAGGFGTALNFSMVQDAFGDIPVIAVDDSGPPFDDQYMPVCMQKKWREAWGFQLPPDCAECFQTNGGGMLHLADFLMKKHPKANIAIISTLQDEVIRLFYSVGVKNCTSYDTADPVGLTIGQVADPTVMFAAQTYQDGLMDLRTKYQATGRFATYYIPGPTPHQHVFRPEFYTATAGGETEAAWFGKFINGTVETVGN